MAITDVTTTKVSVESWRRFVEVPLVTVMGQFDEHRNPDGENPPSPEDGTVSLPEGPGVADRDREALSHFAVD